MCKFYTYIYIFNTLNTYIILCIYKYMYIINLILEKIFILQVGRKFIFVFSSMKIGWYICIIYFKYTSFKIGYVEG